MATRPFTADDCADDLAAGAGRINHHQLTVLAASIADVVGRAGGWLFDQARAGWSVDVWVLERRDPRPLRILGVGHLDGASDTVLRDIPRNGALAVSAELLRVEARVCDQVLESARRGVAEVTVWGSEWPVELGGPTDPGEHRLSVAARAFKASALAAAELPAAVAATETLFSLRADALRPLYPV